MKRKLLSLALVCTMCLSMLPTPAALAASNTLYVSSSGEDGAYTTVQDAYAAAHDGDTICIQGELPLTEPVTLDEGKTVTITGEDGGCLTYTDSTNISNASAGMLTILSGQVTIQRLTVQMPEDMATNGRPLYIGPGAEVTLGNGSVIANGYLAYSGGNVYVDGGSLTMENGASIRDAYVANNTDCYGGGVWVTNGGSFTMEGGQISGNTVHTTQSYGSYGGGVAVDNGSTFTMLGGSIEGNSVDTAGGGIYPIPGATVRLGGNLTIQGNQANGETNNLYLPEDVAFSLVEPISGQVGISCENSDYSLTVGVASDYALQTSDEEALAYDSGEYDIRLKHDDLMLYYFTVGVDPTLDGVSSDNEETENPVGQDYDTVLVPADGYQLPSSITVAVGGKTLDESQYDYNQETGALHIPGDQVAGNIRITVDGDAIRSITVETENVLSDVEETTAIRPDTVLIQLTAANRYALPNEEDISISGNCDHIYDRATGVLTLTNVLSDLNLSIRGAEIYHTLIFDPGDGECATTSVTITESQPTLGELPTPFLEGYAFSGWFAGAERVTADTANHLTDDLLLVARWTQKTNISYTIEHWVEYVASGINPGYTGGDLQSVTHNGVTHKYYRYAAPVFEDGIANGRLELASRTLDALSDDLVMDGFTPSGANVYSVIVAPDGSSVFPLFYDRHRYTVSYNANSGSLGSSEVRTTVTYGSLYAVMPSATKAGYTLLGWYTDAHGGNRVQAGDVCKVTADQTLFAHWDPVGTTPYTVYHLTQNLHDNTVSADKTADNYTVVHTDHLTGTSDTTVDLYAMALEGFIPSAGNVYSVTILPDGSAVAYLYYDRRITDVSFDSCGGTSVDFDLRLYYGGTFAFLPATPKRLGYNFVGWYTSEALTAQKVEAGMAINDINLDGLIHMVLYARWSPKTYALTFQTHGGKLSASKTVTYDQTAGELPTADLRGYNFMGWYDKDGKLGEPEGNLITAETPTADLILSVNGVETPKTLYAWYEPVEVELTFDPGKGALAGEDTLTVTYDKPLGELPSPTREGYTFLNWHLDSLEGEIVTADTICKLIEDTTLCAEYTPNLYVVRLDVNGGNELDKPTQMGTFDAPYGQLPAPQRLGHTFLGWFDEQGNQVTADTILTTAASHTLTARWQANTYTVTLDINGDGMLEGSNSLKLTFGQPYGELPTPQRNGYVFAGWYTGAKDGLLVRKDTVVANAANHTLYAHWRVRSSDGGSYTPPSNTLTFDTDKGSDIPPVQGTPNTEVDLGQYKPTRPGFTFVGWTDGKDTVTSVKLKDDVTVTAVWEKVDRLGSLLNKEKHDAYLVGFADGTIRPDAEISRAEIAQILYRLMTVDAHMQFDTVENSFSDVDSAAWYNISVSALVSMGILKGRGNGCFDPAAPITRAEFAAIMARLEGGSYAEDDLFDDISDCWAKAEINHVASLGWVKGDGSGKFAPERTMTRAEAVAILNRALGRSPESAQNLLPGMKTFPDNTDVGAWYYLDIQEAVNGHDYTKDMAGAEVWTKLK